MGTLFGPGQRPFCLVYCCVEIPSLMGTLFGLWSFLVLLIGVYSRNTLADGHPIRTGQYRERDFPAARRNTLADGHPIRTQGHDRCVRVALVEIPSLMGTLFGLIGLIALKSDRSGRNTLADGHPIRTPCSASISNQTWGRNTLADGHPIRTLPESAFHDYFFVEIPSLMGTLFGQPFQNEGSVHHWRAVWSYPANLLPHLSLTCCASSCTLNHLRGLMRGVPQKPGLGNVPPPSSTRFVTRIEGSPSIHAYIILQNPSPFQGAKEANL